MEEIIKLSDVHFNYDKQEAIKGISLSVNKGEYICLLGKNGSGKSTLVKLINAINMPTSGSVTVDGLDTNAKGNLYKIRKNCAMVFQNPDNQLIATSVEEDVAFGLENIGVPQSEMQERINKALLAVSMSEFAKFQPDMLSGGQKQRVAIAGILAMEPKVILFDEATAMLDPKGRREVMAMAKKLNKEYGITIISVTHHMEETLDCDRIIVLNEGQVVLDDIPKNVFMHPSLKELSLDIPPIYKVMEDLKEKIDFSNCNTKEEALNKICQYL